MLGGKIVHEKVDEERFFQDILAPFLPGLPITFPFYLKGQGPIGINAMVRDLLEVTSFTAALLASEGISCGRVVAGAVVLGGGCASDSID